MKNIKGKNLERRVNKANYKYRKDETAIIKKEELPLHITKKGAMVSSSTVDYTGAISIWYKKDKKIGLFIAFDTKECASKTSFPLNNIHQHQLEFLKFHDSLGSFTFFLIQFTKLHENNAFMTPIPFISKVWDEAQEGGRKSIKYEDFKKEWLVSIDGYLDNIIKSNDWQ